MQKNVVKLLCDKLCSISCGMCNHLMESGSGPWVSMLLRRSNVSQMSSFCREEKCAIFQPNRN
jgi:hypothetical protein